MNLSESLKLVGEEILVNKIKHGWKVTTTNDWVSSPHEVPAILMLITTEVAEAMEAFRKDDPANFEEELADIIIRTVGLAHGLDIDLGAVIQRKMEANRVRPFKHGGKRL